MSTATATDTPRAWVGCLGCYNGGTLNGIWLDGNEATAYGDHLKTYANANGVIFCALCNSDEFWVFDHENYGGLLKGECSPSEAQEIAEKIEAIPAYNREAFLEYCEHVGGDPDYSSFEDAYAGQWNSAEEFAEDLLNSTGELDSNSFLARYFDIEAYTRDLFYDYFITDSGHVFSNY
jgi:antirestriction protein